MNSNKITSESLAEKCGRMAEQYDKDKEAQVEN
jgi:hypothetical protein